MKESLLVAGLVAVGLGAAFVLVTRTAPAAPGQGSKAPSPLPQGSPLPTLGDRVKIGDRFEADLSKVLGFATPQGTAGAAGTILSAVSVRPSMPGVQANPSFPSLFTTLPVIGTIDGRDETTGQLVNSIPVWAVTRIL